MHHASRDSISGHSEFGGLQHASFLSIHRFAIPNDATISQGEREGLQQVYMGVENLLRRQGDIVGLYDPTKYPPDQRIDEVAKNKGIPREQAHAIVIRQKYRRLEAFLRDNLEPPVAQ